MMSRRSFVQMTCSACVGSPVITSLLAGCASARYVNGTLESTGISVLKTEFNISKDAAPSYRDYIIVRNEKLEYPICLYRLTETDYSAILMKCTHQGTELQAAGDHLHCPGHGSEFNNRGQVSHGPAENNLRTFNVRTEEEKLFIELK